ncbi:MAG TPA: mechanosensitive ion channel protein MscS [Tistrella mobilis]|uniref:Small-conductance mechanosensitive channel n=1 Tax=Tistrella mobilis TaxID=171437 RepID=A0A3B9IN67_9PROT|nr:mechanosensitive ion channel protein MscS [Tistrella mobilis]
MDQVTTEIDAVVAALSTLAVTYGMAVLGAIAILIGGWLIAGWLEKGVDRSLGRVSHMDPTLRPFIASLVRYGILILTVIIVLGQFGVQTASIIAILGAAGLAIGLALQGTLSNVAAGVMIILFRPFKLGDFIEVAGEMGTVKDISLNTIELASLSNTQIIVPNSQVWGNVIENYSVYPTRRAEWTFGVGYGANLKQAEEVILNTILADERSKREPEPFIQVNNLNDSSVDFLVRVWVDAAVFFQYQADMKRRVKEALDAEGVPIPFPTRTLHIEKNEDTAIAAQ